MKNLLYLTLLIVCLSACSSDKSDYLITIDKEDLTEEKYVDINFSCIDHYVKGDKNFHLVKCSAKISGYYGDGYFRIGKSYGTTTNNSISMDEISVSHGITLNGEETLASTIFDCYEHVSSSSSQSAVINFEVSFPGFVTVIAYNCSHYSH